jgi:hypothetical protein
VVASILLRKLRIAIIVIALRVRWYKFLVVTEYHLFAGEEYTALQALSLMMRSTTLDQLLGGRLTVFHIADHLQCICVLLLVIKSTVHGIQVSIVILTLQDDLIISLHAPVRPSFDRDQSIIHDLLGVLIEVVLLW